jgi:hypothetical protein
VKQRVRRGISVLHPSRSVGYIAALSWVLAKGAMAMYVYEGRVDPIRYAWERCNHGVPLPAVLARSAAVLARSAGLASLGPSLSRYRAPVVAIAVSAMAAARAAVHSRIVGDGPLASRKAT